MSQLQPVSNQAFTESNNKKIEKRPDSLTQGLVTSLYYIAYVSDAKVTERAEFEPPSFVTCYEISTYDASLYFIKHQLLRYVTIPIRFVTIRDLKNRTTCRTTLKK